MNKSLQLLDMLSEGELIPNDSKNAFANKMFAKDLSGFKDGDIVWIQDKKSKYQGYYIIKNKKYSYIGSMPQGVSSKVLDGAPILSEK